MSCPDEYNPKSKFKEIISERDISEIDDYLGFGDKFLTKEGLLELFIAENNLPPIVSKISSNYFNFGPMCSHNMIIAFGKNENSSYHFVIDGSNSSGMVLGVKRKEHISQEYTLEGLINGQSVYLHFEVTATVLFQWVGKSGEKQPIGKASLTEKRLDDFPYWFGIHQK